MADSLTPAQRIIAEKAARMAEKAARKAAALKSPDEIAGGLIKKTIEVQQEGTSAAPVAYARPTDKDPGCEVTKLATNNTGFSR